MLYPALAQRCGPQGALLARHARREHAEIGAELDAVLEALLKEGAATPAGTREQRRELVKLLQQLEQVGGCTNGRSLERGAAVCACLLDLQGGMPVPAPLPPYRIPGPAATCWGRPIQLQTFVAHQVEEETEILPRVAALPGVGSACLHRCLSAWVRQRPELGRRRCHRGSAHPCATASHERWWQPAFSLAQLFPPLPPTCQVRSSAGWPQPSFTASAAQACCWQGPAPAAGPAPALGRGRARAVVCRWSRLLTRHLP